MVKFKIDQWEVLSARAHLLARAETYYRNYVSSMWQVARFRSQELLGDLWPADTREIEALYAEHVDLELGFCRVYDSSESDDRRKELEDSHTLLERELVNHLLVPLAHVRDPRQAHDLVWWSHARLQRHRLIRRQAQRIVTTTNMPAQEESLAALFYIVTSISPRVVPQFV